MEKTGKGISPVVKVCVTGPESSGKSTLAAALAAHYNTVWVPEFARDFMGTLGRPYRKDDLLTIAKGQLAAEAEGAGKASRVLICDTDLTVIKIWSEHKYGGCSPEIMNLLHSAGYDRHILTGTDIPWQADPLRENPTLGRFFYEWFKKELTLQGANITEVRGTHRRRMRSAIAAIDKLIV